MGRIDLCDQFAGGAAAQSSDLMRQRLDDRCVHGQHCPRVSSHDHYRGSWSSATPPDVDRYGGYLGWHALLVVAGQMLKTRPLCRHAWRTNPWESFLEHTRLSRSDGLWLSDLTDCVP